MFWPFKKRDHADVRKRWGAEVEARLDAEPRAQRVASDKIVAFTVEDFLTAAQCKALIATIDADRRPSTVMSASKVSDYRTSESCDMDRWSDTVRPIDSAIADFLGIPSDYGETMQGQRYAVGQQFRAHHDFFRSNQSYYAEVEKTGGQRTWTAMIYLNDVPDGGATWFPRAGFRASPKRGRMLVWNNMRADGTPNVDTVHEGMAVGRGVKYVVTKWFREEPWLPAEYSTEV